ncbi:tumor necrosis factor ligand superfamily member 14 [Poeciliopsis prolifica]|uniref:tumor necrosis factor ligand superfamily member 14 n=1 Tax=Poeciliopsis prolifica TaxID=188132 RepID=UPI0024132C7A|nr:tumor necrosis factor ligand superfamily member 14 [Poeciliopsis prolifica]
MFFNFKSGVGHRAPSVPSVFVVDTHATRPAVPPRLGKQKKQSGVAQTLLFILVTLALFGVFFEAVLIYRLYQSEYAPSGFISKQISGSPPPDTDTDGRLLPSKPVAHLTDGQDVKHDTHDTHVLAWSEIAEPLLYEMTYKDSHLIIQKEGYYYIYSKVYFSKGGAFYHSVMMQTKMYAGKGISLLEAREYSSKKDKEAMSFSNSFLAGVFYLSQNDAIYVNVSNTKQIIRHKSYENVFGAYMI